MSIATWGLPKVKTSFSESFKKEIKLIALVGNPKCLKAATNLLKFSSVLST